MCRLKKGYADIADGQVHYRHRPGTGAPIIFLHQTASSGTMWEKVMAGWAAGHPLYAFDTPGFGGSFDPATPPSMADYARWIGEAASALELGRFHLVGHHTGCGIGLALSAQSPERLISIAMIGPACLTDQERADFATRLGPAFRPNRSGAYLLKNWEYLRVGGADQDIDLLHREMVDMLRAWKSRPDAYAAAWAHDSGPFIEQLTCPAIAIVARDDILYPFFDRLEGIHPDIRRVVLDKGANFEPDLAADALIAVLSEHIARAEP